MKKAKKIRKFNKKEFKLISNEYGTNNQHANGLKQDYKNKGYKVRIIINNSLPFVYPEGRYFVYVNKG